MSFEKRLNCHSPPKWSESASMSPGARITSFFCWDHTLQKDAISSERVFKWRAIWLHQPLYNSPPPTANTPPTHQVRGPPIQYQHSVKEWVIGCVPLYSPGSSLKTPGECVSLLKTVVGNNSVLTKQCVCLCVCVCLRELVGMRNHALCLSCDVLLTMCSWQIRSSFQALKDRKSDLYFLTWESSMKYS